MEWNKIKMYFGNIRQAVCGKNPFAVELKQVRKECEERLHKETSGMQQLVENLRERVATAENQVAKADKTLGRMMMAQDMLEKTNNNLADLACCMEIGKVEALREFAQKLDWNNVLLRIAKCHISVLSRRDELEQRQREAAQRAKAQEDNFNME